MMLCTDAVYIVFCRVNHVVLGVFFLVTFSGAFVVLIHKVRVAILFEMSQMS